MFQDPGVHHAALPALGHDCLQLVCGALQPLHQHQGDAAQAAPHTQPSAGDTCRRPGQANSQQKGKSHLCSLHWSLDQNHLLIKKKQKTKNKISLNRTHLKLAKSCKISLDSLIDSLARGCGRGRGMEGEVRWLSIQSTIVQSTYCTRQVNDNKGHSQRLPHPLDTLWQS